MNVKRSRDEIFEGVASLIEARDYAAANRRLEAIHIEYHDDALVHLAIHVQQLRIARRERKAWRMLGQVLPILFAVPVSYVQRYLGLALPSRRKNERSGC